MKEISTITSPEAPKAVGPYSHAVRVGDLLFCSGQIGFDPKTMQIVSGDIKSQTERVLQNVQSVLKSAGLDLNRVVKTTCFLKDMNSFTSFNEVYEKFFGASKPARSTVEVARLPKDALVEVEVIASY